MTATRSLTNFYGSFFLGCTKLAICPYTETLRAFMDPQRLRTEELMLGVAACIVLTTVVPVLPTLTSFTFTIALFAASLAMASMFLAYPFAILADALAPSRSASPQPAF